MEGAYACRQRPCVLNVCQSWKLGGGDRVKDKEAPLWLRTRLVRSMFVWKAHLSIHLVAKSRLPLQVERTVAIFLPDPMSCLERKACASFPSEGQAGKCVDPKTQTQTDIPTQYTVLRPGALHMDEQPCSPGCRCLVSSTAISHKQSSTSQPYCDCRFRHQHCLVMSENLASRLGRPVAVLVGARPKERWNYT
ncbi:hypothetical protein CMEL01_10571 [Colletotrichum melonis]|uniref:Uncharacterized protein n=1 Tax=Colletotrichum melonis TaxID=1209925 RepID=A0AAI9TV08_9PEZI|nr:hypothetical protein CMEL01_10571 [Colletotrichum melonis]